MKGHLRRTPAILPNRGKSANANFPVLGIISTLVGTGLAIACVPEDVYPKGAIRMSATMMAAGLTLAPLKAALRGFRTLFRAEYILVLSPIFWLLLDPLQGASDLPTLGRREVQLAFLAIGLFVIGIWIACLYHPWSLPGLVKRVAATDYDTGALFAFICGAFVLGMLPFAVPCQFNVFKMVGSLGLGRWSAPWARGALGGWNAFLDHLGYFGFLIPLLTARLTGRVGWANGRTVIALLMAGIVLTFQADGGGRRIVGVMLGAPLLLYVLSGKRLRWVQISFLAISVGGVFWLLQTMLEYRNVGLRAIFNSPEADRVEAQNDEHYHVDDNFFRLGQIIDIIPKQHPYVYGKYLVFIAIRPIPRIFWPGKPVDAGFDLASAVGEAGVSLTCSAVGELYMSAGLVAVLIGGWLMGRLAISASRLLDISYGENALLIYSIAAMALFEGVRAIGEAVLMSYPILAWLGLDWIWQVFGNRPTSRLGTQGDTKCGESCPVGRVDRLVSKQPVAQNVALGGVANPHPGLGLQARRMGHRRRQSAPRNKRD